MIIGFRRPALLAAALLGAFAATLAAQGDKAPAARKVFDKELLDAISQRLQTALDARDLKAIESLIDDETFETRSMSIAPEMPGMREAVRDARLVRSFKVILQSEMKLRVKGPHSRDGRQTILVRACQPTGGVGFLELLVVADDLGLPRFGDLYTYTLAEWTSETLGRVAATALPALQKRQDAEANRLRLTTRMTERLARNDYEGCLEAYAALDAQGKKRRNVQIFRICALGSLPDCSDDYAAALVAFEKQFPDDGSLMLLMIDRYALSGDIDRALRCIAQLAAVVGPDAELDALAGTIATLGDRFEAAKALAAQAIAKEADCENAYWLLVSLSLEEKAFAETKRLLLALEQQLGVEIADLAEIPVYADFLASGERAKWQAARR
jgi:hypothetical protein